MDVLLINTLLAIPIFLGLWFLFRKKSHRLVLTGLTTILMTPLLYAAIIFLWVFAASYYPSKSFDQNIWKHNPMSRYEITDDLIESELLVGKSENEVRSILGEYTFTYNENHWAYEIGYVPGLLNIDPSVLDVYFENGVVIKVGKHET